MKRILAALLIMLVTCLSLTLVSCDEEEEGNASSSSEFEYNGGILDINPEDGTFGVDFGELFGSGIELPDDEFE